MNSLTYDYPAVLLSAQEPPYLSLYQPTHRQYPEVNDLLDDFGEYALRSDSDVITVPTEKMPARTGTAAIYRF